MRFGIHVEAAAVFGRNHNATQPGYQEFAGRTEIADEKNNFDLSLSRYKTDVFEEVKYDPPGEILDRLIQAEVGNVDAAGLAKVQSGIVRELLELKGMVG